MVGVLDGRPHGAQDREEVERTCPLAIIVVHGVLEGGEHPDDDAVAVERAVGLPLRSALVEAERHDARRERDVGHLPLRARRLEVELRVVALDEEVATISDAVIARQVDDVHVEAEASVGIRSALLLRHAATAEELETVPFVRSEPCTVDVRGSRVLGAVGPVVECLRR